jgi:Cu/Ag efflux pump CusA
MTTTSMIAGMLPLALALDAGSASKRSLGTVVIGGLASSLLLTLILVPVVFVALAPKEDSAGEAGSDGTAATEPSLFEAPQA